jgi:hypothetical protein
VAYLEHQEIGPRSKIIAGATMGLDSEPGLELGDMAVGVQAGPKRKQALADLTGEPRVRPGQSVEALREASEAGTQWIRGGEAGADAEPAGRPE